MPQNTGYIVQSKIIDGDTIPYICLREVIIYPTRQFKDQQEQLKYMKLVRNLKKVYPYAKLAKNKFKQINDNLAKLKSESDRKIYTKIAERQIKQEYEEELKGLSVSQGRLLIKLIDRETGETSYELVKELKGSFSAFLWQSVARIFGSDLKDEYDSEGEDKLLEQLILLIENGQL